jgi:dATP pyrophosphohydrolase
MKRAPFQVLVFPYYIQENTKILYAIFKRTEGYWQGIAGGGEGRETPLRAAKREAFEEAGIPFNSKYLRLDSMTMIPVVGVCGFLKWGKDVLAIPEYCFGVGVNHLSLKISSEHVSYKWLSYAQAHRSLHWDSNKYALWELNHRLTERPIRV